MNFNFSEKEAFYLKRMAALQFSGSKDNYSTRTPIHFLEEIADEHKLISLSHYDAYIDEISRIEFFDGYDYYDFDTIEELVCYALGIDEDDTVFKTYNDAYNDEDLDVYSLEDYLDLYDISHSDVNLYIPTDAWEVRGVAFTHKGAVEIKEKIENHIFRDTRFFAHHTSNGEFPVIMEMLMRIGQELLDEEMSGLTWKTIKQLSPEEVLENYRKIPNERFVVAEYLFTLPDKSKVTMTITTAGEFRKITGTKSEYFVASPKVKFGEEEIAWPFECDGGCKNLQNNDGIKALLNYARYI